MASEFLSGGRVDVELEEPVTNTKDVSHFVQDYHQVLFMLLFITDGEVVQVKMNVSKDRSIDELDPK